MTSAIQLITPARLRQLLRYHSETGIFVWREGVEGPGGTRKAGSVAGTLGACGYWKIVIDGREYKAHRLAVLFMTGAWPVEEVDHRNCRRDDNRWVNLRAASASQNQANRWTSIHCNKRGVWQSRSGNWVARITVDNSRMYLGTFADLDKAKAAVAAARAKAFGEFSIPFRGDA